MTNKEEALARLVTRFEFNEKAYSESSSKFNETQTRVEYINPLFEILGWDVNNTAGAVEGRKDVSHEYSIKIEGKSKAPDYCFFVNGKRTFFLEAKKPAVDISLDAESALQLRRYAWSSGMNYSILTNFRSLAIYDCRFEPKEDDLVENSRMMIINYTEYLEKMKNIESLLSKESVSNGSLNGIEKTRIGKPKSVDIRFLDQLEDWRRRLAGNIFQLNKNITERDINLSVQAILDRIIFLRIAEDRGIEKYGSLANIAERTEIYSDLVKYFKEADEKYNSGLFHFKSEKNRSSEPDKMTANILIDNKILKFIISSLYYPASPYEFSVIPVEILGYAYEKFLGKSIKIVPNGTAIIVEKPEVRKSGGVFYTPIHIVEQMVNRPLAKVAG